MPPSPTMRPSKPDFTPTIIREGESFVTNRSKQTRKIVAIRESRHSPRIASGEWNTANGFGIVEYIEYSRAGVAGPLKMCDTGDWLAMLSNMTQVVTP